MWFLPKNKHRVTDSSRRSSLPKTATSTGLTREVAGVTGDLYEPLTAWLGIRPNRDPLLQRQQPDQAYAYPYGLFEEALDKDAHLMALTTQRKTALLGWDRAVVPADDSAAGKAAAAVVEQALANIGSGAGESRDGQGFERSLSELLDAVPYGLAVSEVVWEHCDATGRVPAGEATPGLLLPARLLSRHPRRFVFDTAGALRLLTAAEPVAGEALPPRKFLVFAPYGRHENPYGLPQLRSVWWLAWFKRQVLKFWVMYCEKYGTPTAVLKHPLGATDREKSAYRRIIGSLQQETGLVVPEGVELSLLEAQRGGGAQAYHDLITFANGEMSKALLGQTLTTEPGERGSYSLGQVHESVRRDIIRADAQALMALINGQLVRWIVDLNFPEGQRHYPQWQLTPPADTDLQLQLEIDRFFSERGLQLDQAELYARYGRSRSDGPALQATADHDNGEK